MNKRKIMEGLQMKMNKCLATVATVGFVITCMSTPVMASDVVIKLADVQAENDVETQFEYKFAELVNEKSNGRIEVQVYPAGQMGEMTDILTSVQSGSIQMTRTNPSWLADAGASAMNLLSLPFLFDDLESANEVLESDIGQQILDSVEESNIMVKAIGYLEPSGRYFFFKNKEVSSLEDISNLKIRVQTNELATEMVSSLGASATPISYNELYSSLQTGIVDGADNPLKGILNMSFYEVGTYVLDMAHQYEASVILINEDFFNGLSDEDQQIITESMEEGAAYYKEISDAALEEYRSQLEEKGMIFVTPDNTQEWKDAAQTIYSDFAEGNEDILQAIIDYQN
jgi:tripartite ATP-independent transporter DctP family solute receptor